jgi:acyl dehydratase
MSESTVESTVDAPPTPRSFELNKADFLRYAGASGDFFPLHTDDEYARAAGQPGVFAHGMYSAGLLATAVTSWIGVGTLRRYQVRFAAKAWPGERLTSRIVITGRRTEHNVEVVDFDASLVGDDGEAKVIGSGAATPGLVPSGDAEFAAPLRGAPCGSQIAAIDRGPVSNFAAVLRDHTACYHDARAAREDGFRDVPVPPTYPFVMTHWGTRPELTAQFGADPVPPKRGMEFLAQLGHIGIVLLDIMDQFGPGLVLHAEQEFRYHRAVAVGDLLRGENAITSVERGRTKSFATIETHWTDAHTGAAVLASRFQVVHIPRPAPDERDNHP